MTSTQYAFVKPKTKEFGIVLDLLEDEIWA